jgi:hypothetical protein
LTSSRAPQVDEPLQADDTLQAESTPQPDSIPRADSHTLQVAGIIPRLGPIDHTLPLALTVLYHTLPPALTVLERTPLEQAGPLLVLGRTMSCVEDAPPARRDQEVERQYNALAVVSQGKSLLGAPREQDQMPAAGRVAVLMIVHGSLAKASVLSEKRAGQSRVHL